ncbi:MAG: sugar phosphate nucleotidyltransferase, partial [Bdellovibrionaceae bacterium]|nr:sugar phosphate nucleotidyltransferase [Pseudobdellovibrionaceae bacterium]
MNVMILAAGEGRRLRPLTNKIPKPAIPFLNVPLIGWSLIHVLELGIDIVTINTWHLPEKMTGITKSFPDFKFNISHDGNTLLGGGGGFKLAATRYGFKGTTLLMNGDEILIPSHKNWLGDFITFHRNSGAQATLLAMDYPGVGVKFGGIWVDENNRIHGFGKSPPQPNLHGLHFPGVFLLEDTILKKIPDGPSNLIHDVLAKLINQPGAVQVYKITGHWFETGNADDFVAATGKCLSLLSIKESHVVHVVQRWSPKSNLIRQNEALILADRPP